MRNPSSYFRLVGVGFCIFLAGAPGGRALPDQLRSVPAAVSRGGLDTKSIVQPEVAVNVTQHHNNLSRDGLYVDPAFTANNAPNVARDLNFNGTISGDVNAQLLYIEGGPGGGAVVIAVTESNNVYALDAASGNVVWQRNVGTPVSTSNLPCGSINPLGITGTPVVDLASRALLLDAMTTPDGGTTKKHLIYSLNVDTGAINANWPVDVNAAANFGGTGFTSTVQHNHAALGLVNGIVYVPYSGHNGDCGTYHGWVVGVAINNPASVMAWATTATGGGIWGTGGIASDGTNIFTVTGNTFGTGGTWQGGEAIVRLQAGPVFSGNSADYWAPTNWFSLDNADADLGGCGAVLIDVPGATPSQLVLALGKDSNAYLLNRNNLGGITTPIASMSVSSSGLSGQAAASYRTSQGTYFVLRDGSSTLAAFKINPGNPPTITNAWSVSQSGQGSPWVTTNDGSSNAIVWVVGAAGDQRLHGYNGDTGAVMYAGGGANELMINTRKWNTGTVARGRIYFPALNKVYAFTVPFAPPTPTSVVSRKTHGVAGDFDIALPLTGTPGVECRRGGATNDYQIVVTFSTAVTVSGSPQGQAVVTSGMGDVGTGGVANGGNVTVSGNNVTIPLTNIANAQTISVTLYGISNGSNYGNLVIPMSRLLGDVNGNAAVNATDVALTKSASGQPVSAANFRSDITTDGSINATDVSLVKSAVGTGLP